jgi:hypothetical protein
MTSRKSTTRHVTGAVKQARKVRVDASEDRADDGLPPKRRVRPKRSVSAKNHAVLQTPNDEGLWVEEKVTDPVSLMLYRRMWDMIYDLALPHALRILAERDRAAQEALQAAA